MNALEKLLSKRWFVKAVNKDEYYQMKDEIGKYKNFLFRVKHWYSARGPPTSEI